MLVAIAIIGLGRGPRVQAESITIAAPQHPRGHRPPLHTRVLGCCRPSRPGRPGIQRAGIDAAILTSAVVVGGDPPRSCPTPTPGAAQVSGPVHPWRATDLGGEAPFDVLHRPLPARPQGVVPRRGKLICLVGEGVVLEWAEGILDLVVHT